jgi:hypothetical protein
MRSILPFIAPAVLAGLTFPPVARADVVRYHFTPADCSGYTALRPGPNGAVGEWQLWRGSPERRAYYCPKRPTHLVTFRHPYTGQNVTVPLALPEGIPQIEHVRGRIVFNYGVGYTVEARFLPDGSVDIAYNSGLFRPQ